MNEKFPTPKPPVEPSEDLKKQLSEEQAAQAAAFLEDYPETVVTPENRRSCEAEIAEFESLVSAFEVEHSLEALTAIVDLTPEQAATHSIRQPAKLALNPIVALLNSIENNVSEAEFNELKARYKRLSRAVGIINKNKVDHNR
ncbi:MAG: hypothetical protein PHS79_03215 [Patescibacteria group bacterium]|nr:hypothetical protein [Patescibacteria group bacterium]